MHDTQGSNWEGLLGQLGQPVPKLNKTQKLRLRSMMQSTDAANVALEWRVRFCVATRSPLPLVDVDPSVISRAVALPDLARNLRILCTVEQALKAEALVRALLPQINTTNSRIVLSALVHFLAGRTGNKRKPTEENQSLMRLDSATAQALMEAGSRIALTVSAGSEGKAGKKPSGKRKTPPWDLLLDLAFQSLSRCECAAVCAAAMELASILHRNLGTSAIDSELEKGEPRWSYLISMPSRLIPDILTMGCLADAELLGSRTTLLPQARRLFEKAINEALTQKGLDLPLASRQWAEKILGYMSPAEVGTVPVDTEADVNLERMGALLLASWDAKDEGPKALHVFEVFSGICRTAFGLTLVGQPGEITKFDLARHQSAEGPPPLGKPARLLRPSVQWKDGPTVRIIVRALVAPM